MYGMDLPTQFTKPDIGLYDGDSVPSNIDPSKISYASEFLLAHLGFLSNSHTVQWECGTTASLLSTGPS